MLNKSSDRESMNSDGEGAPNLPYSMARQSFDFSRFKGATAPLLNKAATVKPNDYDLDDEEHDEINVKQEVRAGEKRVRLPKNRNPTAIFKLMGSLSKEMGNGQQFSKVADIRKISVHSSRFTSHPRPATASQNTLSKLMNDLDSFKKNKPSDFKLISQLEKKFKRSDIRGNSIEKSKQVIEEEKSLDIEFDPPVERPTLIHDKNTFGIQINSPNKTMPLRIFPQRSLQKLKEVDDNQLDENTRIAPLQRFGTTRTLMKLTKDKKKQNNSSLTVTNDPLEEVGRSQSPQHIMLKYNGTPNRNNKLGDLFTKRRLDNIAKAKPVFLAEGLASRTEVQLSIRLRSDSNATRNKNLIENPLNETESIPCLLMKPEFPTDVVLLYFHANGEDIQQCQLFCELLKTSLNVPLVDAVLGRDYGVPRLQRLQVQRDL